MTAPSPAKPNLFIVLCQVEQSTWCVVRRQLLNGKESFASRIATARPYEAACRAAMDAAHAEKLHLGIQLSGCRVRRFDPKHDMQEPRV